MYSTYLGGSGSCLGTNNGPICSGEGGSGIAVDEERNAYVTGTTYSDDFPTKNAFQAKNNSVFWGNAFLTKLDGAGKLIYPTYLGGSEQSEQGSQFGLADGGTAIAVDLHRSVYVTGYTASLDFPITKNAFQKSLKANCSFGDCPNAFVTKFAPDGESLLYSTYLGGSTEVKSDQHGGIAVDGGGISRQPRTRFGTLSRAQM